MANIFSLFGEVLIDNQKANTSIDQTTEKAEKSGIKIGSALSSITKGAAAMGAAVVAGATTIGTSAYSMAMNTAEQADYIDKLSERTGINREELQRWKHAADQSGVSVDSFKNGVKKMSDVIDDANSGSKAAATALDRLGLSLDDLNGMTTEEQFDAITKALADMEDGAERNALGNDLLGKSYTEMLPLLNAGSEGIKALKDEADELGIVMSEESVKAGVVLGDTIANIKDAANGLLNRLGTAAIPIVQKFADMIIAGIPKVQTLFDGLVPVITSIFDQVLPPLFTLVETLFPVLISLITALMPSIESIITSVLPVVISLIQQLTPFLVKIIEQALPMAVSLIAGLMPLITQVLDTVLPVIIQLLEMLLPTIMQVIEKVLPVVIELLEKLLPPAMELIEAILPIVITLLDKLMPLIEPILDILLLLLDPLLDLLDIVLPPLIDLIEFMTEKLLPPLEKAFAFVAETIGSQFKGALESLRVVIGNVRGVFNGIIDFVKNVFAGNWRGAWKAIVDIFSNYFGGIKEAFKVPINWIIDGINSFIRGLNKIQIPDWVPAIGGKGFNIPEFKRLRIGLEYVPYDEYPALLHKGERVLTASENKEYSNRTPAANIDNEDRYLIKIEFGEKSIYIENLKGDGIKDVESFVDLLLELIAEKMKRKGVIFA